MVLMFLVLHIMKFENSIEINQSLYVRKILEKFNLSDIKPLSVPIEPSWTSGDSILPDNNNGCREMVGSLMYLMAGTRPDISFAVNVAARVEDKPTQAHLNLVRRIFKYLEGSIDYIDYSIKFVKMDVISIESNSDADHA